MTTYKVKSESNPKVFYEVKYFDKSKKFVCSCPSYIFGKKGKECKHIKYIKEEIEKFTK